MGIQIFKSKNVVFRNQKENPAVTLKFYIFTYNMYFNISFVFCELFKQQYYIIVNFINYDRGFTVRKHARWGQQEESKGRTSWA